MSIFTWINKTAEVSIILIISGEDQVKILNKKEPFTYWDLEC